MLLKIAAKIGNIPLLSSFLWKFKKYINLNPINNTAARRKLAVFKSCCIQNV
tara:strand:- start:5850 stop:6005 length:156 start_codon:yes stop_codon:yes gene_type:complete